MKWLTSLVLLVVVNSVTATEQISERLITKINVYEDYAVAWLDAAAGNVDACTKNNAGQFVKISFGTELGKEMYSTVLAARVSKQTVGFGVTGCSSWGTGTIPLVYRVDL